MKERRFAVKCLHADIAQKAEMAARFLREAESASSIKHPNVVDVFDVHHLPTARRTSSASSSKAKSSPTT